MTAIKDRKIGHKLALLAKSKGYTQSQIAQMCGVSRITIQRFFNGKTEIRSGDLDKILKILNLDIETDIEFLLKAQSTKTPVTMNPIKGDLCFLLESLEPEVRKTILNNICWWTKDSEDEVLQKSTQNLKSYVTSLES